MTADGPASRARLVRERLPRLRAHELDAIDAAVERYGLG